LQEGILDGVLGLARITKQAQGHSIGADLMATHQLLEGIGMTDYYGVSGRSAGPEQDQMTEAECERKVALLRASWRYFDDVAARVSAVFAREVGYADLPPERAREQLLAGGLTPWETEGTLEVFDWIRSGGAHTVTTDVHDVTGEDPRPVEDWLSEFRGAFLGPPQDVPPPTF